MRKILAEQAIALPLLNDVPRTAAAYGARV
jgi:hypothetical protein